MQEKTKNHTRDNVNVTHCAITSAANSPNASKMSHSWQEGLNFIQDNNRLIIYSRLTLAVSYLKDKVF